MNLTVRTVLLVLALIFFALSAAAVPRANWQSIGLALFAGAFLFP